MLKAKLDSVRKNKKGFSLVELIIVIAIMVALIAVMAPSFVKYVQKSRDAALTSAAEDYYTAVKTYYGDADTTPAFKSDSAKIVISVSNKQIAIAADSTLSNDKINIDKIAGLDTSKKMGATEKQFTITVNYSAADGYTFKMTDTTPTTPAA